MRDDKPFGGPDPPAALFRYSRDRSGEHPVAHLETFTGILQADIYTGYNALYVAGRSLGPVGAAILFEAGLSFLGLGDPDAMSWGLMMGANRDFVLEAWWAVTLPGLAIFVTILGVSLIGDGLSDTLDPRRRGAESVVRERAGGLDSSSPASLAVSLAEAGGGKGFSIPSATNTTVSDVCYR